MKLSGNRAFVAKFSESINPKKKNKPININHIQRKKYLFLKEQ